MYCQGSLKRKCTIILHLDGTKFSGALRFGDAGESGAIGECGAIGEEGDIEESTLVKCRPWASRADLMQKQKGQTQTQIQTHTQMSHTTDFWGSILSLLPALLVGELDDMGEFVDIGDFGDIDTDDTGDDGDESEFALKRAGRAGFISADRQTDKQIDK